jgi:hypothetical protein
MAVTTEATAMSNPYESPRDSRQDRVPSAETGEALEVSYEVVFDDLLAFNEQHLRRNRAWLDVLLVLIVACFVLVDVWTVRDRLLTSPQILLSSDALLRWIGRLTSAVMVAILLRAADRFNWFRPLLKTTLHLSTFVLGRSRMLGNFRCRATPQEITEFTPRKAYSFKTSRVRYITVDSQHVMIFVSLLQAIVIPRRAFASELEVERFASTVERFSGKHAAYC